MDFHWVDGDKTIYSSDNYYQFTKDFTNHRYPLGLQLYPVEQTAMKSPRDIRADPLFARLARDPREADFDLRKGSPAIGSDLTELPHFQRLAM